MMNWIHAPSRRYRIMLLLIHCRDWIKDAIANVRAVIRAVHATGTYGSEARLHLLTTIIGIWVVLPIQSVGPFRALGRDIPKEFWGTLIFIVALYGLLQMFLTRGNLLANEEGRSRALFWDCLLYGFLTYIYIVTAYPGVAPVIFAFFSVTSWGLYKRLSQKGPR